MVRSSPKDGGPSPITLGGYKRGSVVEEIALINSARRHPDHLGPEIKAKSAHSRASYSVHGPAAGDERTQTPDLVRQNDHHHTREQRKTLAVILEQERADRNAKLATGQKPKNVYKRNKGPPLVHADPWNLSQGLGPNGIAVTADRLFARGVCGEDGVHTPRFVRESPRWTKKYPSFMPGVFPWSEASDPPMPECGPQVSIPLLRKKRKAPTDSGLGRLPPRPASCPPGAGPKMKGKSVSFSAAQTPR
eukprot:gnl/MRDRNA2_/MRDRNA2_29504_c0_seq1.p1 gnl/MRDRNA2_/MRDRNA2_29504_c0~~gnl/MRDRNA2_/MRDRNA2_29504_c0_seq1.p1  ORF type:complete len:248 (+),score=27.94 gnl/MRDRNA2_/MRDRNA2_29504_c0_seq1:58-801(+)